MSTVGEYHEYRVGIYSVLLRILSTVGDITSTVGDVQYRGGINLLLSEYLHGTGYRSRYS